MSKQISYGAMLSSLLATIGVFTGASAPAQTVADWRLSPAWTQDLVIYEIATKAFTSPHGPEGVRKVEALR